MFSHQGHQHILVSARERNWAAHSNSTNCGAKGAVAISATSCHKAAGKMTRLQLGGFLPQQSALAISWTSIQKTKQRSSGAWR